MIVAADPDRPPPEDIGPRGGRVWNMVTALDADGVPVYVLRPDELVNLERWARAEDMVADLEFALAQEAGPRKRGVKRNFWVPSLQGTYTVNGLLSEIRQWNAAAMAAAKQIKLPDLEAGDQPKFGKNLTREHQSEAGKARWRKAPAETG